jgi:hypothetical protein
MYRHSSNQKLWGAFLPCPLITSLPYGKVAIISNGTLQSTEHAEEVHHYILSLIEQDGSRDWGVFLPLFLYYLLEGLDWSTSDGYVTPRLSRA